ncbi:MAG: hypothetical protein JWQ23_1165 [Herminiimonas sp.]|nr:hypothetical protein [Herminiimonas sp.]
MQTGQFMMRRLLPALMIILAAGGWILVASQKAGLFGLENGIAVVFTLIAVMMGFIVWCGARIIDCVDASNDRASKTESQQMIQCLTDFNTRIEAHFAARTAQLEAANRKLTNEIYGRNLARAPLRANEESYRFLFECNPLPLYIYDHVSLRFTAVNQAAIRQYGYSREEFLNMSTMEIRAPDEAERFATYHQSKRFGHQAAGHWRHIRKDGKLIDVEIFHYVLTLDGRPKSLVLALDITERLAAERELQRHASRLQILSQQLLNVQEAERSRIARELHDQIGQTLTAAKLGLQSAREAISDPVVSGQLADCVSLTTQVLDQVRSLSLDLRPPLLDELGLAVALECHLKSNANLAGWTIEFSVARVPPKLPTEIATTCFRVAQEALTNVMRHAQACHVSVELRMWEGALHLLVSDDGAGFDLEASRRHALIGKSIGLLSMTERAILVGGQCEIISAPGKGTTVRAVIPLPAGPAAAVSTS